MLLLKLLRMSPACDKPAVVGERWKSLTYALLCMVVGSDEEGNEDKEDNGDDDVADGHTGL